MNQPLPPLPLLTNPAKPRTSPPRIYRNSPGVMHEAGDNVKLEETQGGQQVTYKISATISDNEPIKGDTEIMHGDSVNTPLSVDEHGSVAPGLMPQAPAPESGDQCKCLRGDGTWTTFGPTVNTAHLPPPPPPLPPPLPPPPPPKPVKPCKCPPRVYRNPPDVILEAGDNIELEETQGDQQVTYKISAVIPAREPVKVDPDIMYGDGVNTPLGVYDYDGDKPGLVPHAPAPDQNPKYLADDGTWAAFDQSVNAESSNAVTGHAVAAALDTLEQKVGILFDSITAVPVSEAINIVQLEPGDGEEEIPFD